MNMNLVAILVVIVLLGMGAYFDTKSLDVNKCIRLCEPNKVLKYDVPNEICECDLKK